MSDIDANENNSIIIDSVTELKQKVLLIEKDVHSLLGDNRRYEAEINLLKTGQMELKSDIKVITNNQENHTKRLDNGLKQLEDIKKTLFALSMTAVAGLLAFIVDKLL